ncbi:unnamed protein product [Trifolium pratense]|uniref:Uncharacterized protein n=1 Tax=Trifolium pratense TaxID=57577 RepID=A0ACB0LQ19_TRIPR|nr:unnamed protein product [Trifolium pratense]
MFTPSLQIFSQKSSSSPSSNLTSMKLKRIIHTLLVSHLCRIIRALSKVKHFIVDFTTYYPSSTHKKRNNIKNKIILGSFRLHYNWCSSKSSHVLPVPEPVYEGLFEHNHNQNQNPELHLAGYLQWLEEEKKKKKKKIEEGEKEKEIVNDNENIDMLAEMFIANCHEKFKLEKQESDRRFQDMLARSM